jgi:hypothetical protein
MKGEMIGESVFRFRLGVGWNGKKETQQQLENFTKELSPLMQIPKVLLAVYRRGEFSSREQETYQQQEDYSDLH